MNRPSPVTAPRRRAPVLLALAFAVAAFAVAASPGRPEPVSAAVPPSAKVATSYILRSSLSYAFGTISTRQTIRIRNTTSSGIRSLNLSVLPRAFGELVSLSDVRLDGVAVATEWTNNSNLLVDFGRTLAPRSAATLTLSFAVKATGAIGTSLEARLSKANGIMQVSHWFPIVSDGHAARYPGDSQSTRDATRIRLELTTDSSAVRIAAPGRRVSASGRSHVYEIENARDFAFGASPYYRVLQASVAGETVGVYYTNGNGSAALKHAVAAIATFEQVYGEYQWPRYILAQTGRPGSGNEYPGIVFLGSAVMADRETVAHETAHQWWYAMAGNDQLREPWLDEGIAEFSAAYFFGDFHSYSSTRPINSPVYDFPNRPAPDASGQAGSYDQTIYFKSARFLEGLRVRMGSQSFFAGLRAFFEANRNGFMSTREFYDVMVRYGAPTSYLRSFIVL